MRVVVYTMVIEGRTDNLDLKDLPIYYQGFRLGIKDLNSPLFPVFVLAFLSESITLKKLANPELQPRSGVDNQGFLPQIT